MSWKKEKKLDVWVVDEILPHCESLRKWISHRFSDFPDVEDIVQESIFRVMKAHETGPIINPRAYLFLTARNLVYNRFRHLKYEQRADSGVSGVSEILDELDDPLEVASKQEEIRTLIHAIQSLPRRCRQVITLRKIYGYSLKEVAEIMGISVKTVDAQSCIALKKCTDYFVKHGFGEEFK